MKINLKFAELHNALFLAGSNLQMKLNPIQRQGLRLIYDRTEKELLVYYNNEVAIVPSSNVSSMTPEDPKALGEPQPSPEQPKPVKSPVTQGKIKAQASSPTDHVFADAPGKVRS